MSLNFRPLDTLEIGKPCRFEMNIKQADGSPLSEDDVGLVIPRKSICLRSIQAWQIINTSTPKLILYLRVFGGLHSPEKAGNYRVYLDLIPLRSPRRVLLGASFTVPGDVDNLSLSEGGGVYSVNDRTFRIESIGGNGSDSEILLRFTAQDKEGDDLPLRPVMGAFAHLVAFEPNTDGFAHLHPLE